MSKQRISQQNKNQTLKMDLHSGPDLIFSSQDASLGTSFVNRRKPKRLFNPKASFLQTTNSTESIDSGDTKVVKRKSSFIGLGLNIGKSKLSASGKKKFGSGKKNPPEVKRRSNEKANQDEQEELSMKFHVTRNPPPPKPVSPIVKVMVNADDSPKKMLTIEAIGVHLDEHQACGGDNEQGVVAMASQTSKASAIIQSEDLFDEIRLEVQPSQELEFHAQQEAPEPESEPFMEEKEAMNESPEKKLAEAPDKTDAKHEDPKTKADKIYDISDTENERLDLKKTPFRFFKSKNRSLGSVTKTCSPLSSSRIPKRKTYERASLTKKATSVSKIKTKASTPPQIKDGASADPEPCSEEPRAPPKSKTKAKAKATKKRPRPAKKPSAKTRVMPKRRHKPVVKVVTKNDVTPGSAHSDDLDEPVKKALDIQDVNRSTISSPFATDDCPKRDEAEAVNDASPPINPVQDDATTAHNAKRLDAEETADDLVRIPCFCSRLVQIVQDETKNELKRLVRDEFYRVCHDQAQNYFSKLSSLRD